MEEPDDLVPAVVRFLGSEDRRHRNVRLEGQGASKGHTPKESFEVLHNAVYRCSEIVHRSHVPQCLPEVWPDGTPSGLIQSCDIVAQIAVDFLEPVGRAGLVVHWNRWALHEPWSISEILI